MRSPSVAAITGPCIEKPLADLGAEVVQVESVPRIWHRACTSPTAEALHEQAGAPRGTLSEMRTITSRIYGGARANYWIYCSPGLDTVRGAPLMVWLDGQNQVGVLDVFGLRMQTVTDNLVHRKQIPPMVHLLLAPATGGSSASWELLPGQSAESAMRSLQFDTVSNEFGRYPEQHLDGGYIFPFLIRREPRRNIRVWLSDGMNDIDIDSTTSLPGIYQAGSWPLANLQMAQALKTKLYDFHFRYGNAFHSSAQWALDLPESLAWLWRGYDPAKTAEVYEQEAAERAKPVYRVQIVNRDAW